MSTERNPARSFVRRALIVIRYRVPNGDTELRGLLRPGPPITDAARFDASDKAITGHRPRAPADATASGFPRTTVGRPRASCSQRAGYATPRWHLRTFHVGRTCHAAGPPRAQLELSRRLFFCIHSCILSSAARWIRKSDGIVTHNDSSGLRPQREHICVAPPRLSQAREGTPIMGL